MKQLSTAQLSQSTWQSVHLRSPEFPPLVKSTTGAVVGRAEEPHCSPKTTVFLCFRRPDLVEQCFGLAVQEPVNKSNTLPKTNIDPDVLAPSKSVFLYQPVVYSGSMLVSSSRVHHPHARGFTQFWTNILSSDQENQGWINLLGFCMVFLHKVVDRRKVLARVGSHDDGMTCS